MSTMAAWQGLQNDSISSGNTRLLMIFVGLVAFSMLIQAIVVIVVAIGAKKTQTRVLQIVEELRLRALPILDTTEDVLKESIPKFKGISTNLLQASEIVRAKVKEFDTTLSDANTRTKAQVARVDGMVSTALSATSSIAAMIHHGIRTPVVEAVGVVNGFKAGLDVLLSKSRSSGTKKTAIAVYKGDLPGV